MMFLKTGDVCSRGLTLRSVVDGAFTTMNVGYVNKNEVDAVKQLFDVIRTMGDHEYQATLNLFKRTAK